MLCFLGFFFFNGGNFSPPAIPHHRSLIVSEGAALTSCFGERPFISCWSFKVALVSVVSVFISQPGCWRRGPLVHVMALGHKNYRAAFFGVARQTCVLNYPIWSDWALCTTPPPSYREGLPLSFRQTRDEKGGKQKCTRALEHWPLSSFCLGRPQY